MKVTRPYFSLPAESGTKDISLIKLSEQLDLSRPSILLDYACGQGRLLAALLSSRSPTELKNLRYIGVDSNPEALRKAHHFFNTNLKLTGSCAAFLTPEQLFSSYVLLDQIVLVFTVHELEPSNLHKILGGLWRMLRRGGSLYIQDTSSPIHEEIEFIGFTPNQISSIFQDLDTTIGVTTTLAGRRQVPVFLMQITKPASLACMYAYSRWDLGAVYRKMLHRAVLADCFALLRCRNNVQQGSQVNAEEVAALCHRIAVRARAFHQTMAYDEVNSGEMDYCIACGSLDVEVDRIPSNVKDPEELTIRCHECQYNHFHLGSHWRDDDGPDLRLFTFLDLGQAWIVSAPQVLTQLDLWTIIASLSHSRELLEMVGPILEGLPSISDDLRKDIRARVGLTISKIDEYETSGH